MPQCTGGHDLDLRRRRGADPVHGICCDACGEAIVPGAAYWACEPCFEDYCDSCRSPAANAPSAAAVVMGTDRRHESGRGTLGAGGFPTGDSPSEAGNTGRAAGGAARSLVGGGARRGSAMTATVAGDSESREAAGGRRRRRTTTQGATVREYEHGSGPPSTTSGSTGAATTTALPQAGVRGQRGGHGTTKTTGETKHHGEAADEGVREILGDRAEERVAGSAALR
jgi:hypothetical protein